MKRHSLPPQQDDSLKRAIVGSIIFHAILFIAFAVRMIFYSSEPLDLESAIRVDMVDLPEKKLPKSPSDPALPAAPVPQPKQDEKKIAEKPQPPAPPPPAPAHEPRPVPPKPENTAVNLNKVKQEQSAALKRLEALQKLEKMMKSRAAPSALSASQAKAIAEPVAATAPPPSTEIRKGEALSNGSSDTGIIRLDKQNYLNSLNGHIKKNWNLPQWLSNANLRARVRIYVDSRGMVVKKDLTLSSKNPDFDERVLQTVEASSPLPIPPGSLANRVAVDGIELGFPD